MTAFDRDKTYIFIQHGFNTGKINKFSRARTGFTQRNDDLLLSMHVYSMKYEMPTKP